jgi:hypothetical protein
LNSYAKSMGWRCSRLWVGAHIPPATRKWVATELVPVQEPCPHLPTLMQEQIDIPPIQNTGLGTRAVPSGPWANVFNVAHLHNLPLCPISCFSITRLSFRAGAHYSYAPMVLCLHQLIVAPRVALPPLLVLARGPVIFHSVRLAISHKSTWRNDCGSLICHCPPHCTPDHVAE